MRGLSWLNFNILQKEVSGLSPPEAPYVELELISYFASKLYEAVVEKFLFSPRSCTTSSTLFP